MLIGFIVVCIVAAIFLGIGYSCRKAKEAVGFFNFTKPPIIEDVENYNKAVSILWFVASGVMFMSGIPFLFLEQNSPLFVWVILALMLGVIVMMIVYLRIENKYKK